MRDISGALEFAQTYKIRKPYVELIFHNVDDSDIVDYSDRRMGIEHHEYPFGGKANILLNNNDREVQDLRGYWVDIFYGDDLSLSGGAGFEGRHTPRLWVKSQMDRSSPGVKQVILELEDSWAKLEEAVFISNELDMPAPYHFTYIDISTPFWIITFVLNTAGFGMQALVEDDGIIDSLIPTRFEINKPPPNTEGATGTADGTYDTPKDLILKAFSYTKSYPRTINDIGGGPPEFQVVYPQEGDPADLTYYSYQPFYFKEFIFRENLVVPNMILTYCDWDYELGEFKSPPVIGLAADQESIDDYGQMLDIVWFKGIDNTTDAYNVADAVIERLKIESKGGRLIIDHDIRPQLFDMVEIHDGR